ncbi:hypothetical protein F5883DRAFT_172242 [Diaporthe sp. PMI_573]|nr:hypothetical protein F5883DRAFT_172242 [Diaporthaceae sp. PMI_573]
MLDENLPTFQFKQSNENPLASIVYFTQNGSEPAPEYVFKRADPSNPAARRRYAVALTDPFAPDVVYAEVVVEPEWSQPTLSAAEVRAQQHQNGNPSLAPQPMIPDNFTIYLYNPDQAVSVKYNPGSLTKSDTWEFEMLSQSFKMPSNSQIDRQTQNGSPVADFRPRIMFRWKKEGRKDMSCFNVGKSVGKHKSKEPDITVALFKQGRATAVTVYEPNLQRIDMEDRKGLDIVLVLGAEVIRDLYLAPDKRPDLFNVGATGPLPVSAGRRKNSRPSPPPAGPTMAGALGPSAPQVRPVMSTANIAASSSGKPSNAAIDAETERLKAMVEREEKERQAARQREDRERERRDREEQKRIKQMLEDEDKEKRRREAEIAKETDRLRKLYGTEGQEISSGRPPAQQHQGSPPLPNRPQFQQNRPPQQQQQQHPNFAPPPQRPTSVGPGTGPFHSSTLNNLFAGRPSGPPPQQGQSGPSRPGRTKPNQGPYLSGANPAAAVSGFFSGLRKDDKKITKKRSVQW